MDDDEFDAMLPAELRPLSEIHFTPVAVARRAAQLLVDSPGGWFLDVGAAVGKFCIVGAAVAPECTFVGVERRRPLVRIANQIAVRLELPNVAFLYADAIEVDWSTFDGFYLFNPFTEHLGNVTPAFDHTIDLDPAYFLFYVNFVRERLADARIGTRVVTYHGFGGERPPGYTAAFEQRIRGGPLELWIKTGSSRRSPRPPPASSS